MQFNFSFIIIVLLKLINSLECAPTELQTSLDSETSQTLVEEHQPDGHERKKVDYYEYRRIIAEGVQKALDECREKFKYDRWNCPKKAFSDILARNQLPSNKELGLTRALIAAGTVVSTFRSCSYGTNNLCGCSHTTNVLAARPASLSGPNMEHLVGNNLMTHNQDLSNKFGAEQGVHMAAGEHAHTHHGAEHVTDLSSNFIWRGCDASLKFAFKVSRNYLDAQEVLQDETSWKLNAHNYEASRRVNAHNYEAGRLAVKKFTKKICKCHGVSGSCQVETCWKSVPDMSVIGDYLKRQYRSSAKLGAMSAEETNVVALNKELAAINNDKLVFIDASPDYCYENPKFGINGTLGRYCSMNKHRTDGKKVSRYERDSCDRLCTKCGYKIKKESLKVEKQCDCRFVYCCSVECKRCPHVEETYRCVRHS